MMMKKKNTRKIIRWERLSESKEHTDNDFFFVYRFLVAVISIEKKRIITKSNKKHRVIERKRKGSDSKIETRSGRQLKLSHTQ